MATLFAPGTEVTIINETFFIPAQATTVPVIFGVTAEQKLLSDGLTVASGTTVANKIRSVSGIGQSQTLFGIPRFYRDSSGNELHGDSRNEYGLAALNYCLGITALAYFIRADVNTDDTRANLLTIWDRLIAQAAAKVESDATAKLNLINLTAGVTLGNPGYRTSLTKVEITPIIQAALNTIVHTFYSFREKTAANNLAVVDDPVPTVWSNIGYTAGSYVYKSSNATFYKALATVAGTDVPGVVANTIWQAVTIDWKNTKGIFQNDRTTMPFKVYGGPAGFSGLSTGTFTGVLGHVNAWNSGAVVAAQFTPLEAKSLVVEVSDDFVLTKEFGTSTSLGADDASRRVAIVRALQKAVLAVPELYGESITYTIVIAPGFPELVDNLNGLYVETRSETAVIADGPMNMDPDDYYDWARASNASGLNLSSSNRTLPADYPSRLYGDHYYYYGCGVITNLDGRDIVVPASVIGLRTICYSDLISYPWFAPAGIPNGLVTGVSRIGYLSGELGTATTFIDAPLRDTHRIKFAEKKINAIPFIDGSGYVVFSQTTSAPVDSELASINVDRLVKYIKRGIRKNSKPFLFKPNDQRTRDQFKAFVDGFLSELVTLRGLFDFVSLCDKSNNYSERVAKKELWCEVAIQPITAVEFIYVPITVKKPA